MESVEEMNAPQKVEADEEEDEQINSSTKPAEQVKIGNKRELKTLT